METKEEELKAKAKDLRAKLRKTKKELKEAKTRIETLEKENYELLENSNNLEKTLSALKTESTTRNLTRPTSTAASRSKAPSSHPILLLSISSTTNQPISGSMDSSSSTALQNDSIHLIPAARPSSPSLSSSDTSEGRSAIRQRPKPTSKVRFADTATTITSSAAWPAPLRHLPPLHEEARSAPYPASNLGDSTTFNPDGGYLVARMKNGDVLDDEDLQDFAQLFFDQDASVVDFISSQQLQVVSQVRQLSSSSGRSRSPTYWSRSDPLARSTPSCSESDSSEPGDISSSNSSSIPSNNPWLGFLAPTPSDLLSIHSSPWDAFSEHSLRLCFRNISQSEVGINVHTFPSRGSFLGFTKSRSQLHPQNESFLSLCLVGTSLQRSLALSIVVAIQYPAVFLHDSSPTRRVSHSLFPSSSPTKVDQRSILRAQYYIFASNVEMVAPKRGHSAWKIALPELKETSTCILSTPFSVVKNATLLESSVSSRIFKSNPPSDWNNCQRFIEVAKALPSHSNIISVIGVSEKRPFRIITQGWTCSLTSALMATCAPQRFSLTPPNIGEFSAADLLFSVTDDGLMPLGLLNAQRNPADAMQLPSLSTRLEIALQILASISVLHEHNFVHRDLTTNSFGLVCDDYVLLVDLNSCLQSENLVPYQCSSKWIAPEITLPNSFSTFKSDIYALGVILFDLVIGAPLSTNLVNTTFDKVFDLWSASLFPSETVEGISSLSIPDSTSLGLSETVEQRLSRLIASCCDPQPTRRPNLSVISRHLELIKAELESP